MPTPFKIEEHHAKYYVPRFRGKYNKKKKGARVCVVLYLAVIKLCYSFNKLDNFDHLKIEYLEKTKSDKFAKKNREAVATHTQHEKKFICIGRFQSGTFYYMRNMSLTH